MAQNGKPIKARRIGGVKVVPKWNWTPEYTLQVRRHDRALSKGNTKWDTLNYSWRDSRNCYLAEQYRDWLRSERMPNLTPDEADHLIWDQRLFDNRQAA